ncbi:MAG: hypothetical protein ACREMQ_05400, partial [Longimicrobiales bacterium]
WGIDPSLTTFTTISAGTNLSGSADLTLTADVQSFDPYEVYYFRMVASSPSGTVKGGILRVSLLFSVPKL